MSKEKKDICVLGLGYIGLPTASMFATHGYQVTGVDTNKKIIQTLKEGKLHIEEPGLSTVVKAALSSENLKLSDKVVPSDVYVIAVPTPYQQTPEGQPRADLTYVRSAAKSILTHLKKGDLIILESTSPPGTTKEVLLPLIKEAGFEPGKDVGVAYCPERVIPGKALKELVGNDRIIGAISDHWAKETRDLYRSFVSGEIFLTDPTVAEMAKVVENTYRDVNIALANELSVFCEKLGISVWDVIRMANRHPRVNVHTPGPGVGGHCISVDPWFLVEKFPDDAKVITLARTINDARPQHVVSQIKSILVNRSKAKVALLGLSYKANVDDMRESPSVEVINLLKENHPELELAIYDPHVSNDDYPQGTFEQTFQDADLIVLLTAHKEFCEMDPAQIGDLMKTRIVYDTSHALKAERWLPAGFEMYTLGDGDALLKLATKERS